MAKTPRKQGRKRRSKSAAKAVCTPIPRVPGYCHHRGSGQAFVKLGGKVVYLGVYGSEASRDAYAAIVSDVLTGRDVTTAIRRKPANRGEAQSARRLTVADVAARFNEYAKGYYVKNGEPTSEAPLVAAALEHAVAMFGDTPAETFGPLALKTVRQRMVGLGHARTTVNKSIERIRRAFKWAASEELIPAAVVTALSTVAGLSAGRTAAKETAPVLPVDDAVVSATLRELPDVVADMVRLQRLTGMRPGEVCNLRPGDLERDREVWVYRPAAHKTQHHGRQRTVFIGPKAQQVLLRYLARDAKTYCFRPCDSEIKRRAARSAARQTPLSCGNRPGNHTPSPLRPPGEKYTTASYGRAINRACKLASVAPWSPNRLRHSAATEIRARFGLEAAQTVLGHSTANMTERYAEKDLVAGAAVARTIG